MKRRGSPTCLLWTGMMRGCWMQMRLPGLEGKKERKKTASVTSQWSRSVSLAFRSACKKLTGSQLNRLQATSALPRGTDVLLYRRLWNVKKRLYLLLGGVTALICVSLHLVLFSGQSLQRCVHQTHTYTRTHTRARTLTHRVYCVFQRLETSRDCLDVAWSGAVDWHIFAASFSRRVNTHQPLDGGKHSEFKSLLLKALSRLWLNPPTHQWHLLKKKKKSSPLWGNYNCSTSLMEILSFLHYHHHSKIGYSVFSD